MQHHLASFQCANQQPLLFLPNFYCKCHSTLFIVCTALERNCKASPIFLSLTTTDAFEMENLRGKELVNACLLQKQVSPTTHSEAQRQVIQFNMKLANNSMFYLIRINRRDKPHSRVSNDNISKIIHAQVTKGQISITVF